MDYCFGTGDGTASIWVGIPELDLDGDGELDGVRLDFDGDGVFDDAIGDFDGDGVGDHAVLNYAGDAEFFTDDGTGTWPHPVAGPARAGPVAGDVLRWFDLDGVEHRGGPLLDFDGDGQAGDLLIDSDGDGLADRVVAGDTGYADIDGDGRWDIELTDTDGDGAADAVKDV